MRASGRPASPWRQEARARWRPCGRLQAVALGLRLVPDAVHVLRLVRDGRQRERRLGAAGLAEREVQLELAPHAAELRCVGREQAVEHQTDARSEVDDVLVARDVARALEGLRRRLLVLRGRPRRRGVAADVDGARRVEPGAGGGCELALEGRHRRGPVLHGAEAAARGAAPAPLPRLGRAGQAVRAADERVEAGDGRVVLVDDGVVLAHRRLVGSECGVVLVAQALVDREIVRRQRAGRVRREEVVEGPRASSYTTRAASERFLVALSCRFSRFSAASALARAPSVLLAWRTWRACCASMRAISAWHVPDIASISVPGASSGTAASVAAASALVAASRSGAASATSRASVVAASSGSGRVDAPSREPPMQPASRAASAASVSTGAVRRRRRAPMYRVYGRVAEAGRRLPPDAVPMSYDSRRGGRGRP